MLDPLTTLGAIANIAQFIDFAIRLFASSRDIYLSTTGSLAKHADLENVTRDISVLSQKLQGSLHLTNASVSLTEDEQAIASLCEGCILVSTQLTDLLENLKCKEKLGKFRSLRKALKSVCSKDEIDGLEKRVRLYKEELNVRILADLRSKVNILAVQQSDGFDLLDADTKKIIRSFDRVTSTIRDELKQQRVELSILNSNTQSVIETEAHQRRSEHEIIATSFTNLSKENGQHSDRLVHTQEVTKAALELSIATNIAEHDKTREEMQRLKEQAEAQIKVLTEEIRQLKLELEDSVKTIVTSIGNVSVREQQRLKEISNAKFNLWVAKELILDKLKAFIAMFKFNFGGNTWSSTMEVRSWKLMPYPKYTEVSTTGIESNEFSKETSMAYSRVDLCYPIVASNVPMVKMCLEQGAAINARISMDGGAVHGMTPLEIAFDVTCKRYRMDSRNPDILAQRRHARRIVQLLLQYGADPDLQNGSGFTVRGRLQSYIEHTKSPTSAPTVTGTRKPAQHDWSIEQILRKDHHVDRDRLLAIVDAAWDADYRDFACLILEDPEICVRAQSYGISLLCIAAYRGNGEMIERLLFLQVLPTIPDSLGCSPLDVAILMDRPSVIRLLIDYGADFTSSSNCLRKLSPLEYIACEGNNDALGAILGSAAFQALPYKTESLWKPMGYAIKNLKHDIVKLLLAHGADGSTGIFLHDALYKHRELPDGSMNLTPLGYVSTMLIGAQGSVKSDLIRLRDVLEEWQERQSQVRPYKVPGRSLAQV